LVIMVPLLVLATVVTQAFAFEAIRTLEGYWTGPAGFARTLMIRKHVRRKRVLASRHEKTRRAAFYAARPQMIEKGISFSLVNAMEADMLGVEIPPLSA